jgi:hypothetical protein
MNKKLRDAMNTVVQHNWSDEIEDYVENCGHDPSMNMRKGHIFESLVLIANAIDGTKYTPEWWVEDYCKQHDLDLALFGNEVTA